MRSQRRNAKHLRGRVTPVTLSNGSAAFVVHPLCGDTYEHITVQSPDTPLHGQPWFTEFPTAHDVCGACQSKFLAAQLKAEPIGYVLGKRIDPTTIPAGQDGPYGVRRYSGYKSIYPVLKSGIDAPVAFITIDRGWGKAWEIHPLVNPAKIVDLADGRAAPEMSCGPEAAYYTWEPLSAGDPMKFRATRLASKELALTLIPGMLRDGLLHTRDELLAEQAEMIARAKARQAERLAEDAERDERRTRRAKERAERDAVTRDGFKALLARADLTNIECAAIMNAASSIGLNLGVAEASHYYPGPAYEPAEM